jgi:UPF0755 protein
MTMGSDVTVLYALHTNKTELTAADLKVDSLYNTYKFKGLPLGPIANPGEAGIKAALYPDEKKLKDKYLYFVVGDPETGRLVYSKTLSQHEKATDEYNRLKKIYDEKHKTD